MTVTALLAADLTGLGYVTSTMQLSTTDAILLAGTTIPLTHLTDTTPPTTTIATKPGAVIGTDQQGVTGIADDGGGSGVANVEVSLDNATWQVADGTDGWTANITITADLHGTTQYIYARATDQNGQVGPTDVVTLNVDTIAPVITPTFPALVGGSSTAFLEGTAQDLEPTAGEVAIVGLQVDDGSYAPTIVYTPEANGEQPWRYTWSLPVEDSVTHTVRFFAMDHALNIVTDTVGTSVIVDTVAPQITVTLALTQVTPWGSSPALGGIITDGGIITEVVTWIYPETGATVEDTIAFVDGQWAYTLTQPIGTYDLYVQAADAAGNTRRVGPYKVEVVDALSTVWQGDVDDDWDDPRNWSPHHAPDRAVSALIPDMAAHWPQISGTGVISDLVIANGAALHLLDGANLEVWGTISNSGRLTQAQASLPVGVMARFPQVKGQMGASYLYLGVDITPTATMTDVAVAVLGHQACTNVMGETVNRCFDISVGAGGPATVTFHYLASELNGHDPATMLPYHWNGSQWEQAGDLVSRDATGPEYAVTMSGVAAFSPFVLASEDVPTAVVLRVFLAQSQVLSVWGVLLLVGLLLAGGVVCKRRKRSR